MIGKLRLSKIKAAGFVFIAVMFGLSPLVNIRIVNALPITNRYITLSNSLGNASGVTYALSTAALPTPGTAVKSVAIDFCTSLTDSCSTTPSGFSSGSSTLASQPSGLGAGSGWTVNTSDTGALRISNASNSTTPSGAVSITWNGVHNPTTNNQAFYGIITTYSDASWTTAIDTGSVALSTSAEIQVALTVNEALTFCTGTSITGENCGTISGNTVDLGNGSTTSTANGTSVMAASTNGSSGYTITVNGSTLTSGSNTITALASGGSSSIGSKQFGINLAPSNSQPVVGAAITGSGSGAAAANYGTNNTFRFATGETVASASGSTNANTFTISYIANIDGTTQAGIYSTNLNYIATANF